MNLESLSIPQLELSLLHVTKDTPNKPIATASQVLRLCKLIDDLRTEKAELKSKIENLSTTFFHEHYGSQEMSAYSFKQKVLGLL